MPGALEVEPGRRVASRAGPRHGRQRLVDRSALVEPPEPEDPFEAAPGHVRPQRIDRRPMDETERLDLTHPTDDCAEETAIASAHAAVEIGGGGQDGRQPIGSDHRPARRGAVMPRRRRGGVERDRVCVAARVALQQLDGLPEPTAGQGITGEHFQALRRQMIEQPERWIRAQGGLSGRFEAGIPRRQERADRGLDVADHLRRPHQRFRRRLEARRRFQMTGEHRRVHVDVDRRHAARTRAFADHAPVDRGPPPVDDPHNDLGTARRKFVGVDVDSEPPVRTRSSASPSGRSTPAISTPRPTRTPCTPRRSFDFMRTRPRATTKAPIGSPISKHPHSIAGAYSGPGHRATRYRRSRPLRGIIAWAPDNGSVAPTGARDRGGW